MYKSIYVPVDNSDHSNRAVACSIELAIIGWVRSRYGSRPREGLGGKRTQQPASVR